MSTAETEAQLARARALWQQSRPEEARTLLRQVLRVHPGRQEAVELLAEVLRSQGRLGAACAVLLEACRSNGFPADLSLRSARFAQACDRHAIAAQICAAALVASPAAANPELLVVAGHIARERGDFAEARARYLAALEGGVDLDRNHVLAALANTKRYTDPGDPDIVRLERHFGDAAFSARSRASAGFGLAKIRNDLCDYAAAARTLRTSNAMVRAVQPWNAGAWRAFVAARTSEGVTTAAGPADARFMPVFIVGLPRTGTTLTATLLARATGARDRGELRALRYVARQLIAGGHLGDAGALAEGAALYRTLAIQDDAPAGCYLDQDPLNFRWLNVAAALFPAARAIHLRRDSRDTALSLWSQDFGNADLAFAYDFDDIAAYRAGHDALLRHWQHSLPLPMLEINYEELVAAPDATIARLCDFIGLPAIEPAAADTGAPVQSASVWQARQPVYTSSVGRWKHYAPFVPELARFGSGS